ncbi:unnamed protein product, partial [Candidula unifasciata]
GGCCCILSVLGALPHTTSAGRVRAEVVALGTGGTQRPVLRQRGYLLPQRHHQPNLVQ